MKIRQHQEKAPGGSGKKERAGVVFTIHMLGTAIGATGDTTSRGTALAGLDLRRPR
ncbi:MAG TPA: hypothetical protein VF898_05695 [Chloroflexota bacterium]